jgi:phenylacetate-CoA ligase
LNHPGEKKRRFAQRTRAKQINWSNAMIRRLLFVISFFMAFTAKAWAEPELFSGPVPGAGAGGYSAFAVAEGPQEIWTVADSKLYLNFSQGVQKEWRPDIPGYAAPPTPVGRKCWNRRGSRNPLACLAPEPMLLRQGMTEATTEKYYAARKFYESLMRSQWLPTERIIAYQETQLQQMLAHAFAQVPFYREPLGRIRLADGKFDLNRWSELPIIDKEIVSKDPEAFRARELPRAHQSLLNTSTSGSEGQSLGMLKTRFDHTGTACASYRYANWFGYDYSTPLAMIRSGFIRPADPNSPEDKLWGPPWIDPSTRGARHRLNIKTPVEEQLYWLMGLGPVYLNTLPSNAMALVQLSEEVELKPAVKAIMTVGEKLSEDVRNEVLRIWGCKISDVYSTAETGLVAIECPDGGGYHLQTEISRAEAIGEDGEQCRPGETGSLVCTSIYNFAMPMIRYRFADMVTMGEPCRCGRGLAKLSQIVGRTSSLLKAPDGHLYAPEVSTPHVFRLSGAREWQLEQQGKNTFKMKLKTDKLPNGQQQAALQSYLTQFLHNGADVRIETTANLPHTRGGKFYPIIRTG